MNAEVGQKEDLSDVGGFGRQRKSEVQMVWGVKIPLRDGIHLNGTLYLPASATRAAPCVVTLTPYMSDSYHERGMYFAAQGLPFMAVDVRGRGNSEGTFRPMAHDAVDGYDVVEWVAQQPYCNGKVAMWGGSYGGYNQWVTAKESPPHLATIVPVAAPYLGGDFPMRNNIFYPCALQWSTYTAGRTLQTQIFNDQGYWSSLFRRWYSSGRSFRDLAASVGPQSAFFKEWLDHPEPDSYWENYNPTAEQYGKIQIPILTITGIYDDDQPGALDHYRRHMRGGPSGFPDRHYLIMGPWDHSGTRTPRLEVGGVRLGHASLLNLPRLHAEWYLWTAGEGERPEFLKKPVAYYVTGAEQWRYADFLEEATSHHQRYFLDSVANASDVLAAGMLTSTAGHGAPDHYRFDPTEAEAPELDAEAVVDPCSLVDQSIIMALSGKLLAYHTAPFTEEVEITGFIKLSVWLAIDTPDTDFYVSVYALESGDRSIRLATDAMRARYRKDLRSATLINTHEPLRYDFERFTFTSRRIQKGSRLRLIIAPIGRVIDGAFVQKNYNGGGVVSDEDAQDGRPVTVRLFHDAEHPSALHIPIGTPVTNLSPDAPASYFEVTQGVSW